MRTTRPRLVSPRKAALTQDREILLAWSNSVEDLLPEFSCTSSGSALGLGCAIGAIWQMMLNKSLNIR